MQNYSQRPRNSFGQIGPEDNTVSFTPPDGLELQGNAGKALVAWRRKPDGDICIESFDGVSLGDSEEQDQQKPDSEGLGDDIPSMDDGDQGA